MDMQQDAGPTAGQGWAKTRDGQLVSCTNVPDAEWLRRKRLHWLGCAERGPSGNPEPAMRKLIQRARAEGMEEDVEFLEGMLKTFQANREARAKEPPQPTQAEEQEDARLARMAANVVQIVDDRAEARKAASSAQGKK